jgi:hypothetical protein
MKPPSSRSPRLGSVDVSRREFLAATSAEGLMAALESPAIGAASVLQTAASVWDRAKALDGVIDDAVNGDHVVGATIVAAKMPRSSTSAQLVLPTGKPNAGWMRTKSADSLQ